MHTYPPTNKQMKTNYIHTSMHAYEHICILVIHAHAYLHTCMHTYMRMYTFLNLQHLLIFFLLPPRWAIHMCIYAYAYVYEYMHTCVPTHPRTYIRSTYTHYTYACMHTYIQPIHRFLLGYIHACIHLYVHTRILAYMLS